MITFKNIRNTFLAVATLALGAGTLTSCDDDNMAAMKLNGEWYGDFGMHATFYERGIGYDVTWECYDSYMNFNSDIMYSSSGYCKQVDYYYDKPGWFYDARGYKYTYNYPCPYERIYHRVRWSIDNGVITFHYQGEREWDTKIYDYALSNSHFTGRFSETGASFDLTSISYGSNWWSPYNYSDDRYYYCYSRATGEEEASRADGFTLCKTEEGNVLVDNPENPTMEVVLREGVDPSTIDLSSMRMGNRNNIKK